MYYCIRRKLLMRNEFNGRCRVVDPTFPKADSNEFLDIVGKNPKYFFDYLESDCIVDIICCYADSELVLAKNIAIHLGSKPCEEVEKYLIWTYLYGL